MLSSFFSHRLSFRLLIPITAFLFAAVAGISVAAWLDAPGAPPNYGTPGCTPKPCEEEDFKPMNLSATAQTKRASATFEGDVISNQFLDRQNNAYFLDPASPILAGTLSGALNISQTAPGAKLVINNPSTVTKTGVSGDTIYAYADSANAALSAEQGNPAGYAVYASGGINYFQGNVGIGTNPSDKLDVNGWIRAAGTGQGADPAMRIGVYKTDNTGGISGWWLSQNPTGEFAIHQNSVGDRLIIDGSGNIGISTVGAGLKFPDGTVQTSAAVAASASSYFVDSNTQIFTSSGTFTAPPSVNRALVEIWGAGGGGAGGCDYLGYYNLGNGGGGGGGGGSIRQIISVTPGETLNINIGIGGNGGQGSGTGGGCGQAGSDGNNSSIVRSSTGTTILSAGGGKGGLVHSSGGIGGGVSSATNAFYSNGANGIDVVAYTYAGGSGGSASNGDIPSIYFRGSYGGVTIGSQGGAGGGNTNQGNWGGNGTGVGAGGGGSSASSGGNNNVWGGKGSNGEVIIHY